MTKTEELNVFDLIKLVETRIEELKELLQREPSTSMQHLHRNSLKANETILSDLKDIVWKKSGQRYYQ